MDFSFFGLSLIQVGKVFIFSTCTVILYIEHDDAKIVCGKIQIHPLESLVRMFDEDKKAIGSDKKDMRLSLDSRIFALEPVDNNGNVINCFIIVLVAKFLK